MRAKPGTKMHELEGRHGRCECQDWRHTLAEEEVEAVARLEGILHVGEGFLFLHENETARMSWIDIIGLCYQCYAAAPMAIKPDHLALLDDECLVPFLQSSDGRVRRQALLALGGVDDE